MSSSNSSFDGFRRTSTSASRLSRSMPSWAIGSVTRTLGMAVPAAAIVTDGLATDKERVNGYVGTRRGVQLNAPANLLATALRLRRLRRLVPRPWPPVRSQTPRLATPYSARALEVADAEDL